MTRQGRAITLSISEEDKASLQAIAAELGYTWGNNPNISKLVEAIAKRELLIASNNNWPQDLIESLCKAIACIQDRGDSQNAQVISNLLLERNDLKISLRREIERLLDTTKKSNWRKLLDEFIDEERPFQLSYQDAAQRIWTFNIQYAEIVHRDRREYLQCWCKEINKEAELIELKHNWVLSLDRIGEAFVSSIKAKWKPGLDCIEAELEFHGASALSYEDSDTDTLKKWRNQSLRVIRKISDPLSLYRELLLCAEDAVILTPTDLRDGFLIKLQKLSDRYN